MFTISIYLIFDILLDNSPICNVNLNFSEQSNYVALEWAGTLRRVIKLKVIWLNCHNVIPGNFPEHQAHFTYKLLNFVKQPEQHAFQTHINSFENA